MGKARVCPLKPVTVPRLELNAAVVSVRVSTMLKKELEYKNPVEVFWTDSKVVLGYIANDARRFHVFVANRVQQIRDITEPSQWRHVATDVNPADDGSRGTTAEELVNKSRWLKGPKFLWENEIPVVIETTKPTISQDDPEVRKAQAFAVHASGTDFELERLDYFSEWHRAKRAAGWPGPHTRSVTFRLVRFGALHGHRKNTELFHLIAARDAIAPLDFGVGCSCSGSRWARRPSARWYRQFDHRPSEVQPD